MQKKGKLKKERKRKGKKMQKSWPSAWARPSTEAEGNFKWKSTDICCEIWRHGNLSIFSPSIICIRCFGLPVESCVCRGQSGGWKCTAADSVHSLSCTPATPDLAVIFLASMHPGYLTYCSWWRTQEHILQTSLICSGWERTSNSLGIFKEGESLH